MRSCFRKVHANNVEHRRGFCIDFGFGRGSFCMHALNLKPYQKGKTMRRYLALQLSSLKDSCYWVDGLIHG
jgi:hypothetical protein